MQHLVLSSKMNSNLWPFEQSIFMILGVSRIEIWEYGFWGIYFWESIPALNVCVMSKYDMNVSNQAYQLFAFSVFYQGSNGSILNLVLFIAITDTRTHTLSLFHTHKHTHTHTNRHLHIHTFTHTFTCTHIHLHAHAHTHLTHLHLHTSTHLTQIHTQTHAHHTPHTPTPTHSHTH